MGYSKVFGNEDGPSLLPVGPDQCFDRLNNGKVNVTETLQMEELEELPVTPVILLLKQPNTQYSNK